MSDDKKARRKKEIRERNKRDWRIRNLVRDMEKGAEGLAAPEIEVKEQERERKEEDEKVWSAKLQMIRDVNNKRRHMAKERWNRFAGTGGEGGRGL